MTRPPAWYLAVLAANAAMRLRELAVSRRHERLRGGEPSAPGTYPLMVAAHVALVAMPLLEVSLRGRARPHCGWGAVLVGATALRVWCIRSLGTAWNVRASVPVDLVPVTSGPYRYVRHPNYVAVILEFLAVPLVAGAWVSAVLLSAWNGLVLFDRIGAEERALDESAAYRRAFAGRARLIPGVF
jgi:methyltransferase